LRVYYAILFPLSIYDYDGRTSERGPHLAIGATVGSGSRDSWRMEGLRSTSF